MVFGLVIYSDDGLFLEVIDDGCPGDADGNGVVDINDLIRVIIDWETDGTTFGGDVDGSGAVDVNDLVMVLIAWGPCPRGVKFQISDFRFQMVSGCAIATPTAAKPSEI